jgi:hypothetical protein
MTKGACGAGILVASLILVLGTSLAAWQEQGSQAAQPGTDKKAPAKDQKDPTAWKSLFDGKSLAGWKETNFGGQGEVHIDKGAIVIEQGSDMTGVTYAKGDFPKMDYEVTLEGKKIKGRDFFCTTTFPVGDTHCSLVVGGWGGTVVGLSSIDGRDASENETSSFKEFKQDQWYRVRIRVTKSRIEAWIDKDKVVDQETKGREISIRAECDLCKPFGIATWRTVGAVRDIKVRTLTAEEKKAGGGKAGSAPSKTTDQPRAAPKTAEEARKAFQAQATPIVDKAMSKVKDAQKYWRARIVDDKQLSARRRPYSEALKRVEDTLTEREKKDLILHGTLQDLRRQGDCWAIETTGSRGNELAGYLDARTGELVFLWLIPEG